MNPLERALLLEGVSSDGPAAVVLALVAAFGLGIVVTMLHRWSAGGRRVSPSLQASLALLPVVSSMVLLVIGDSLARAFSLVGALAIVRFRTRLRTTWDITFVFLSLAVGIGCGTGKPDVAALGVGVTALAVAVLAAIPGMAQPGEPPSRILCEVAALEVRENDMRKVLDRYCSEVLLATTRTLRFGETLSMVWQVRVRPGASVSDVVIGLSGIEGVARCQSMSGAVEESESDED